MPAPFSDLMKTVNLARPVRFLRGDLAEKVQERRDARRLAEVLRLEEMMKNVGV